MPDDEFLRYIEKHLYLIASDCFDLRAKERLRELQQKIVLQLAKPPIILTKDTGRDPEVTGQ